MKNQNNVIFLDIDGVLNDNITNYSLTSINCLKLLQDSFNSKIVIISSQQGNGTTSKRRKITEQLSNYGIRNIDFIDPNFEGYFLNFKVPSRILGIVHYLKTTPIDNYVILDDDYQNDYKIIQLNHFKTKAFKGLTPKDLKKISLKPVNLNNFKYVYYNYRQLGEYELLTNTIIKILKKKCNNNSDA